MVVAAAAADIHIRIHGGVGVEHPAGVAEVERCVTSRRNRLKVVGIRQRIDEVAGSPEGIGRPETGVTGTADGTNREGVRCVGRQVLGGIEGVGKEITVAFELQFPIGLLTTSSPHEVGTGLQCVDSQVLGLRAGELSKDNIVDSSRRRGATTCVIGPHKHQIIGACIHVESGNLGLPVALEIHLATKVDPTGRSGVGVVVSTGATVRRMASRELERHRGNPCTQVVVAAFAICLPIETDGHIDTIVDRECTVSVAKLGSGVRIGVSCSIVVGDVERGGTGAGCCRADTPLVGSIIGEIPTGVIANLKACTVGEYGNGSTGYGDHSGANKNTGVTNTAKSGHGDAVQRAFHRGGDGVVLCVDGGLILTVHIDQPTGLVTVGNPGNLDAVVGQRSGKIRRCGTRRADNFSCGDGLTIAVVVTPRIADDGSAVTIVNGKVALVIIATCGPHKTNGVVRTYHDSRRGGRTIGEGESASQGGSLIDTDRRTVPSVTIVVCRVNGDGARCAGALCLCYPRDA